MMNVCFPIIIAPMVSALWYLFFVWYYLFAFSFLLIFLQLPPCSHDMLNGSCPFNHFCYNGNCIGRFLSLSNEVLLLFRILRTIFGSKRRRCVHKRAWFFTMWFGFCMCRWYLPKCGPSYCLQDSFGLWILYSGII